LNLTQYNILITYKQYYILTYIACSLKYE